MNTKLGMKLKVSLEYEMTSNLEKLPKYHLIHKYNIIFVLLNHLTYNYNILSPIFWLLNT